jgi:hypothetical protein
LICILYCCKITLITENSSYAACCIAPFITTLVRCSKTRMLVSISCSKWYCVVLYVKHVVCCMIGNGVRAWTFGYLHWPTLTTVIAHHLSYWKFQITRNQKRFNLFGIASLYTPIRRLLHDWKWTEYKTARMM